MIFCILAVCAFPSFAESTEPSELISKPPTIDSFVASGKPDSNQALSSGLWVGYNNDQGYQIERTLLKYEISKTELPSGSKIQSAVLSLYLAAVTTNDAPMNISVSQIPNNWSEDITWNQHTQLNPFGPTATANATTQFGWYQWNITSIVQAWNNTPNREQFLSLILKGNENVGQHERGFWSKDCKESDCGASPGLRPKLEIQFVLPTPTPTPSPMPTPGIFVTLQNQPKEQIDKDKPITYTISYQNNGIADLQNVRITNTVPVNVRVITIYNSGTFDKDKNVVTWSIGNFSKGSTGAVAYKIEPQIENTTIINTGAIAGWDYQGHAHVSNKSNPVFNPSFDIYLPLVSR